MLTDGHLDDVDFDRQAVVAWSSGESGSCPGWLADIRALDDGTGRRRATGHVDLADQPADE